MDMSLGKLWEIVKDREVQSMQLQSQMWLNNWTHQQNYIYYISANHRGEKTLLHF